MAKLRRGRLGICVDAFPRNFGGRPAARVVSAVVYSEAGREVDFAVPGFDPDFSGIVDHLGCHRARVINSCQRVRFVTRLLGEVLRENGAPAFIEYMNLDIEGSEYEVLRTFPFEEYRFGCISVEHNYEEPKRSNIRTVLLANGYVLDRSDNEPSVPP